MHLILLALLALCFQPSLSQAADAEAHSSVIDANIFRGNTSVGGGISLGYSTYAKAVLSLYPTAEYFIADRLSVGGSGRYFIDDSETEYSIGPSASYYFWAHKHLTSNVHLSLQYEHNNVDDALNDTLRIVPGASFLYFPVRYISFGPNASLSIPLDRRSRESNSSPDFTLIAQFGIYF